MYLNNKIKFFIIMFFAVLLFSKDSLASTSFLTRENAKNLKTEKIYKESHFFDVKGVKYSNLEFVQGEKDGDGRVYFVNPRGYLTALSLNKIKSNEPIKNSDKIVFKKKVLDDREDYLAKNIRISYSNEKIYIVSNYNTVYCVSAVDGDLIWKKTVSSVLETKPVAYQDVIYVVSNDNKTYALNSDTGIIKWTHSGIKTNTKKRYNNTPILYKDKLIVTYSSGEYYILSQKDGSVVFTNNTSLESINEASYFSDFDSENVIFDNYLFISSNSILQAVDLNNSKPKWRKELKSAINFTAKDGFLYYLTEENNLLVINSKSGEIVQSKQLEKYKKGKQNKGVVLYDYMLVTNDVMLLIKDKYVDIYYLDNLDFLKTVKVKGDIHKKPIVFNDNLYINSITKHSMMINKLLKGK